jgi:capsular polysaccharide biosynthesis protein
MTLMSAEKITYQEKNIDALTNSVENDIKFSGRVDINHLLARARKVKERENKINLIVLGMIAGLIIVVGIILSF